MKTSTSVRLALLAATLCPTPAAAPLPQAFPRGDLFLSSPNLTTGATTHGIVQIDPVTGDTTRLVTVARVPSNLDSLAYDPHRDALVLVAKETLSDPWTLFAVGAQGGLSNLGLTGLELFCLAPTGDGRIYARRRSAPSTSVWYVDAAGLLQRLMDQSGTQSFQWSSTVGVDYRQMHYHPPTRSLLAVTRESVGRISCSGTVTDGVVVRRVTLSADGTRAVGPVLCSEFMASPSSEIPVGLSAMDDGDLLLVLDTNTNQEEPRMVRLDPQTLAMTPFATSGYPGAAATTAGTWSSRLGEAVVLDAFNGALRAYAQGESGGGTTIPTPSLSSRQPVRCYR
ncbi:MAG: hypothetical protein AAF628_27570 [Planctomycetota bacterium]